MLTVDVEPHGPGSSQKLANWYDLVKGNVSSLSLPSPVAQIDTQKLQDLSDKIDDLQPLLCFAKLFNENMKREVFSAGMHEKLSSFVRYVSDSSFILEKDPTSIALICGGLPKLQGLENTVEEIVASDADRDSLKCLLIYCEQQLNSTEFQYRLKASNHVDNKRFRKFKSLVLDSIKGNLQPLNYDVDIRLKHDFMNDKTRVSLSKCVWSWVRCEEDLFQRMFLLYDDPIRGKSVFCSWFVCQLRTLTSVHLLGVIVFDYQDKLKSSLEHALRSLAFQIAEHLPETATIIHQNIDNYNQDRGQSASELFFNLISLPLSQYNGPKPENGMIIVIESLDSASCRMNVLDMLREFYIHLPIWIRFVVSSRKELDIDEYLSDFEPFCWKSNDTEFINDLQSITSHLITSVVSEQAEVPDIITEVLTKGENLLEFPVVVHKTVSIFGKNVPIAKINKAMSKSNLLDHFFSRQFDRINANMGFIDEPCPNICVTFSSNKLIYSRIICALTYTDKILQVDELKALCKVASPEECRGFDHVMEIIRSVYPIRNVKGKREVHYVHSSVKDFISSGRVMSLYVAKNIVY